MRSNRSLFICIAAYVCSLGIILSGGIYGLRAALSTVQQPGFLMPEYLAKAPDAQRESVVSHAAVEFKPYIPPASSQSGWRPSEFRNFSARSNALNSNKAANAVESKSKRTKGKSRARQRDKAMDAYASGSPTRGWEPAGTGSR